MTTSNLLHPDRLFPGSPDQRAICRDLYARVKDLPIISPHGHTDPRWFAENKSFDNPAELLIIPDHYVLRMIYSQGVSMEALGVKPKGEKAFAADPRKVWQTFADHYYLFAGTPSRIWFNHVFYEIFGLKEAFTSESANRAYDVIDAALKSDAYLPRALLDRFDIQLIATTEGALDDLSYHAAMVGSGYEHRVITTFRPDDVIDADKPNFAKNLAKLAELTGFETSDWKGYLNAMRVRREYFRKVGRATATDHGHPTARTSNLPAADCQKLLDLCLSGKADAEQIDTFRGQMLTEMAGMSVEDGMTMQIHPGSYRNHNPVLFNRFGPDKGADIPMRVNYTEALQPLLSKYGNEADLNIILFTLDESNYARELAPLAGHYPCLTLGPPWWFHDSPQGMARFRDQVTETAGIYNTAGFNDDTRAFLSIPARHDVARRMDCVFLSGLIETHKITEKDAHQMLLDLTYNLAVSAYKLPLDRLTA